MKQIIVAAIALAAMSVFLVGTIAQRPGDDQRFASFEMTWASVTPDAVAVRAQAAAEVMTGQRVKLPTAAAEKSMDGTVRRMRVSLPEAPQLEIKYLREYDELRIIDRELSVATSTKSELSRDGALRIARKTFEELAGRKVIDPRHFNWDKLDVASTLVGDGDSREKNIEKHRIEYRFTLRRVINGIELANSGIRIAVHNTGRVSSLRIGGVSVASRQDSSGREEPTGRGRWLTGAVGDPSNRFQREVVPKEGKAKVVWSRVMYVMPENKRAAVVEPMHVVSYSLEFPGDEGTTVVSRRRTVGFSLVDPKAAPIDLTPPVRAPLIEKIKKELPKS